MAFVFSAVRAGSIWSIAVGLGLVVSCGGRTGLFTDEGVRTVNNGPEPGREGGADERDADLDALPPIDVARRPDASREGCADASETYVYVVSEENELFSFYPPTLSFTPIGKLACPSRSPGATPFSMAVDRRGVAYVVFTDGNLYRVSTATAACVATSYQGGQGGFRTFGMGFASDFGGPEEHLFVADFSDRPAATLGSIDPATMTLTVLAPFVPTVPRAELTGTADGRLFAFWPNPEPNATGAHVAEIDKTTARVLAQTELPIASSTDAFAFAFWGGDFWIFTGSGGTSTVSRFRPADGTTVTMTKQPSTIVGAGVSTCAPQG